ncbi:MAG: hypothetical protein ACOX8F_03690 [Sakamotonia sp.]|jgi:hypothetical protein
MKAYRKYMYMGLPVLGVLFYLFYLHRAAIDLVYSDYIRLILSYLPDVWDPEKFFVPDLLTRIPVNFLERAVNVELFGYSVTFDRVMGVLGFGLSALIIGAYSRRMRLGAGWFTAMMVFMFSLNKWEMLYNGTGWAHFLAFGCFFYNYYVLERVYGSGGEKKGDRVRLRVLPALVTIGVAGPYCAIYIMTLVLAYLFVWIRRQTGWRQTALLLASAVLPLALYLWSNSMAVYEYSGAVEGSMLEALREDPGFFLKFLLKSFASMIFGVELINRHMAEVPGIVWCLAGALVAASYVLALWMNFYYGIEKKTIFPLMLLAGGGMNHLMVLVSRWIFMPRDAYGMSSRYALQYQIGILGIFLTFALVFQQQRAGGLREDRKEADGRTAREPEKGRGSRKQKERPMAPWVRAAALAVTALFLGGNLLTTAEELSFAEHRKQHNINDVKPVVLNFENETDETLETALEYHKPGIREALSILKENGWNVFGEAGGNTMESGGKK